MRRCSRSVTRPGGARQIRGVHERVTQVRRHPVDRDPGDRTAAVTDRCQQVGSGRFDVAEVVAGRPHPLPQRGVGPPGLLRGGGSLRLHGGQRPVHADERLERLGRQPRTDPDGRDTESLERVGPLGPLERDLQGGTPGRCSAGEQFGKVHPQRVRQGGQGGQLRLALAVFHQRERRGGHTGGAGDVVERATRSAPVVPQATPDGERIGPGRLGSGSTGDRRASSR